MIDCDIHIDYSNGRRTLLDCSLIRRGLCRLRLKTRRRVSFLASLRHLCDRGSCPRAHQPGTRGDGQQDDPGEADACRYQIPRRHPGHPIDHGLERVSQVQEIQGRFQDIFASMDTCVSASVPDRPSSVPGPGRPCSVKQAGQWLATPATQSGTTSGGSKQVQGLILHV
jgi:hypothetical protein